MAVGMTGVIERAGSETSIGSATSPAAATHAAASARTCPECGVAEGRHVQRGLTRRGKIVPALAMLLVLIPVVVCSVSYYSRVPEPSGYGGGYQPMAMGIADVPTSLQELSVQSQSGDRWARQLLRTESPWRLCPAGTEVYASLFTQGSSAELTTTRFGWPFEWMEETWQHSDTPVPSGTPWTWIGPQWIGPSVYWARSRMSESTQSTISLLRSMEMIGVYAIVIGAFVAVTRRWKHRRRSRLVAGVCVILGLGVCTLSRSSTLPIVIGSSVPFRTEMSMGDVQRLVGRADADAQVAGTLIRNGLDGKVRVNEVGLATIRGQPSTARTWRVGWPVAIVGTKNIAQPKPEEAGLRVELGRNGELTVWQPCSGTDRYRVGRVLYIDALVGILCACWLAYVAAWWTCFGYDRVCAWRWRRSGRCVACGYDLR